MLVIKWIQRTWTRLPRASIRDMNFTRRVVISEEHGWKIINSHLLAKPYALHLAKSGPGLSYI